MLNRNENLRVTLWGMGINTALGVAKCIAGWFFQSKALIADGLHSILDLSSDLAVLYGLTMARKPRDANHPYGHHKFSSLAGLFIATLLVLFCILIIASAFWSLRLGRAFVPGWPAFWVALGSLLAKEFLFHWTRRVARRQKSRLLLANAWHHRTDSLSSLAVVLVILGIQGLGPEWAILDSITGLILGVFLLLEGGKLLVKSCNDLLDTAPEAAIINDLREHILPTPGARAYHNFRARRVGDLIEVDLHLQVDPELSVEEGHTIAGKVRENILRRHPEVMSVLVHVEPATTPHLKEQGVFDFEPDGERPETGGN